MLCLKTIQNYFHLSIFKADLLGSARKWHGIKTFCVKLIVVCLGTSVAGHFIKVFCRKPIVFCPGKEAGTAWPPLLTRAGHGWHGLC
jgi:hypothetical protein